MKASISLIWALVVLAGQFVFGQDFSNLHFRKFQVTDGLSENSVYSILQDQTGYLWFGTKDGLNRFDGNNFRVYQKQNHQPESLGNNFVRSLAEKDSSHLYVGTDDGLFIMDKIREEFQAVNQPATNGTVVSTAINALLVDQQQRLWLGTMGQGVFRYDPAEDMLRPIRIRGLDLGKNATWCLLEDKAGTVWAGTRLGLLRYNPDRGEFETVPGLFNPSDNAEFEMLSMMEDSNGHLWLGTWGQGLLKYNKSTATVSRFLDKDSGPFVSHIRSIFHYQPDRLLVGSDDGLYLVQTDRIKVKRLDRPHFQHSLSDQNVYTIAQDREGGIWIGTYFGGVNYLNTALLPIETFHSDPQPGFLSGKAISQFCEDPKGNLWIATEDGGINYYDRKTGEITQPIQTTYHNTHALLLVGEKLLIGTFSRGLDVYDLKTKSLQNYRFDSRDSQTINDDCIFSLYQSRSGEIYVGTPVGLNRLDLQTGAFTRIPEVQGFIYDIQEDAAGDLWLASYQAGGPLRFHRERGKWIDYRESRPQDPIAGSKLTGIYPDSHGRLLFSSEGNGIFIYNRENDTFRQIGQEQGLPNTVIYGILDDPHGYLWLSSNQGLLRIHPDKPGEIKSYTTDYGLQSNQYNFKSALKAKDGKFFFGGVNGFSTFYPQQFTEIANPIPPTVAISQIELLDSDNQQLSKEIQAKLNQGQPIVLPHNQASFTLSFVGLSFTSPDQNQYAYRLVGADETWTQAGSRRSVTYVNVAPGKYTFHVRASNNDAVWNLEGHQLMIEILPPVWLTLPAKMAYGFLAITALLVLLYWLRHRSKTEHRHQLERIRMEEEQKSFQSKIDFFTQVTHEIRTPVSLITAPLEEVLESKSISPEVRRNLQLVDRNCHRLHILIDQLLDFRKMEEGKLPLTPEPIDLRIFLPEIYERFRKSAQKNGLKLEMDLPKKGALLVETDAEALGKIVGNLLSNALKFSRKHIRISLRCLPSAHYTIEVRDDGIGIPADHQELVFNPFYQADKQNGKTGTGIGLSLVKNFADQIGGSIELESTPTAGTRFLFHFSNYPPLPTLPKATDSMLFQAESEDPISRRQRILIVEDNRDLCAFIAQTLREDYQIDQASHGGQALKLLEGNNYALIVSDIMMPGIDGLTLVEKLRGDLRYSHIPVILLSARIENSTKIRGLLSGADVFIEKPFSPAILKAQIASLLRNRHTLLENFQENPLAPFSVLATNNSDEQFLQKLNEEIEKHLDDQQFTVDSLVDLLGLSRSNFQRKLKAISGYSPGDYLRTYRLKRASILLLESDYRISEIAYKVGFKSPSYFTKAFLKAFKMTPREFAAQKNTSEIRE